MKEPQSQAQGEWLVERLRFSAFPSAARTMSFQNVWETVVGSRPETTTQSTKHERTTEQGEFGEGSLVWQVDPRRVDWHYVPKNDREGILPNLGNLASAIAAFDPIVDTWLNAESDWRRLACGAVLQWPVESLSAAKHKLREFLPTVQFDPEICEDVRLRINRFIQATHGIDGVSRINRVADWQVVFWKQLQFEAAGAELSATDTGVQACVQVELDINTDALREEAIPSAALQEIVAALRSHLKHLAEHGDQA